MEKCLELEKTLNNAIDLTKEELLKDVTLDFKDYEKDSGEILIDCVNEYGVQEQWTLFDLDYDTEMRERCDGRDKEFLLSGKQNVGAGGYSSCPFRWISEEHRFHFYTECLEKFSINTIQKKARNQIRKLQNIAVKFKAIVY